MKKRPKPLKGKDWRRKRINHRQPLGWELPDDIDHDPRLSNRDKMTIRKQMRISEGRQHRDNRLLD